MSTHTLLDDLKPNASQPTTFHPFVKLPIEIQLKIWQECLDHYMPRTIELDEYFNPADRVQLLLSRTPGTTPLLLWTCVESRRVALERYSAWGPCQAVGGFGLEESGVKTLFPVLLPVSEDEEDEVEAQYEARNEESAERFCCDVDGEDEWVCSVVYLRKRDDEEELKERF